MTRAEIREEYRKEKEARWRDAQEGFERTDLAHQLCHFMNSTQLAELLAQKKSEHQAQEQQQQATA